MKDSLSLFPTKYCIDPIRVISTRVPSYDQYIKTGLCLSPVYIYTGDIWPLDGHISDFQSTLSLFITRNCTRICYEGICILLYVISLQYKDLASSVLLFALDNKSGGKELWFGQLSNTSKNRGLCLVELMVHECFSLLYF